MSVCPNCGKEVSEVLATCPDCGYRLKEGFSSKEIGGYITVLKRERSEEEAVENTNNNITRKHLSILTIECPLVFIDIETTGLDKSRDRIIEFSAIKILSDGNEKQLTLRINPEIPIPPEATEIHGIKDNDVKHKQKFSQCATEICNFLNGCDLAGFNIIGFDLPLLETEFKRANVEFSRIGRNLVDSQIIFHMLEPRNLAAAYRKYCGKELDNAHRAEADVRATVEVLEGQLHQHPELPRNIQNLADYCLPERANYIDAEGKFIWSHGTAICSFGKFKGMSLKHIAETEPGYLEWLSKADFSLEVQDLARNATQGKFPKPM